MDIIKILGVRPKLQAGAGVALADLADHFQFAPHISAGEPHVVFLATAANPDLEVLGQRVDDGDADAVQAAGVPIVPVGELCAGMQHSQDDFSSGPLKFRVGIHRHAPPVVVDFQRAVLMQRDGQPAGVSGQDFVNAVVDDFLREVIRRGGVGVHAGALAHRL